MDLAALMNTSLNTSQLIQMSLQRQYAAEVGPSTSLVWISLTTYIIFMMQAGFAFLQAGFSRFKNSKTILLKAFINVCIVTVCWWLVGYGFAYGSDANQYIGGGWFAGVDFLEDNRYHLWLFQWAVACIVVTVVSGILAERIQLFAFCLFALYVAVWIYPLPVHWIWASGGWLQRRGFKDLAGACVVHMIAGWAGFIGNLVIGKRKGKFDKDVDQQQFKPSNNAFIVLGTSLIWFGFYGYNCGSTYINGNKTPQEIGKAGMNTTIAASSAGLTAFFFYYYLNKNNLKCWHVPSLCNGILSGLVAVSAGCGSYQPEGAFVIGIISAIIFLIYSKLMELFKIDDPCDSFAVHGGAGFCGLVMRGFFDDGRGIFYGGSAKLFGTQIYGGIATIIWVIFFSVIFFFIFSKLKLLRVPEHIEQQGLDVHQHGGKISEHGGESANQYAMQQEMKIQQQHIQQ